MNIKENIILIASKALEEVTVLKLGKNDLTSNLLGDTKPKDDKFIFYK